VKRRYITTYKPNGLDEISRPGSGSWPAKWSKIYSIHHAQNHPKTHTNYRFRLLAYHIIAHQSESDTNNLVFLSQHNCFVECKTCSHFNHLLIIMENKIKENWI
jgi:hypothetical protein